MKTCPELTTLDNGLRILCDFMPERESVAVGIWVKTGSRYENLRRQGISHFLEHMLFKGSLKRSSRQISQAIEGQGGTLNGFTSEECTCYWAKVRAKHLTLALDVLLDIFFNPRLAPEEMEKEKGVIKEEIRMYRDIPAQHAHHLLQEIMWPHQPLGRSILGERKSIDRIGHSDLITYQNKHYVPGRTVVVVCGNAQGEEVVSAVRELIPGNSRPGRFRFQKAQYNRLKNPLVVEKRDIEQSHLCLGLKGLPRLHPQRYVLSLLDIILGANMSSRLFQEVREKRGWAYSIYSAVDFYQDAGGLQISAGVPADLVKQCLKLIVKQLKQLSQKAPSRDEFERAREYFLGQMALFLEQTTSRMIWLGKNLICSGIILSPEEVFKKIRRIKRADISKLAQCLFRPERLCLSLVGPVKEKERMKLLSALT